MPKLLFFLPCERVIVEQGSNTISLISIFQEVTPQIAAEEIPKDAAIPFSWFVASSWLLENEAERDEPLEHSVILEDPDGSIAAESRVTFRFEPGKTHHRSINNFRGFPIGIAGTYMLRLRVGAPGSDLVEVATYPLKVIHKSSIST